MKNKSQKNKQNGKMTLDKLALMVGGGFSEAYDRMNKGFEVVNERFDRIEIKLDSLERRVFAIENILTEHGKDIREIKNILTEHGKDIKEIKADLKMLKKSDNDNLEKIFELEQRIKVLETKAR